MKILFIGLDYHTYTRNIVAEMELLGAEVTNIDIQPRSMPFKIFMTLLRSQYDTYLERLHNNAIRKSASIAFDKVIFLQAHQISLANLAYLRKVQPSAEFTLYNWDSLSNHDYRQQAGYFDRVLTFDRLDARSNGYGYLPLFCQRSMQGLRRDRGDSRTLFMVGNIVKPVRYKAIESFRTYCEEKKLNFHQHLKISPVVWARLIHSKVRPTGISLRSIQLDAFQEMIETSCGVFDFANHDQSGQTMRMMENLCCGKKIVTNNLWVKQEPFYTTDRIHVFEGLDFTGVEEFLQMPLKYPDAEFPEYHIQSFVRQLVGVSPLVSASVGQ